MPTLELDWTPKSIRDKKVKDIDELRKLETQQIKERAEILYDAATWGLIHYNGLVQNGCRALLAKINNNQPIESELDWFVNKITSDYKTRR